MHRKALEFTFFIYWKDLLVSFGFAMKIMGHLGFEPNPYNSLQIFSVFSCMLQCFSSLINTIWRYFDALFFT